MSDPFSNPLIPRSTTTAVMMAAMVLAAQPALAMFSGEIAPEQSAIPSNLPIVGTFMIALAVAVIFFIISHVLSRR